MKKNNRIWNLFLLVLRMILWSAAAAGLVLLLASAAGIRTYAVLSGSMEPSISTGSVVFVDSHRRTPKEGDVITYRLGQINVTHRVKSIVQNGYLETAGDANELSDAEYVSAEQVLGTVCLSIPRLGYLIMRLRSLPGILGLLILMAAYVYTEHVPENHAEQRGEQEKILQE